MPPRPAIDLRPASRAHVSRIARRMRPVDVRECFAKGRLPDHALRMSLASSSFALTAFVEGSPHAMLGVTAHSMVESVGRPWMLGTEEVYNHGRELLTYGPRVVDEMQRRFRRLENVVAVENVKGIRLLRHLGFTIDDKAHEVGGVDFVQFWREI